MYIYKFLGTMQDLLMRIITTVLQEVNMLQYLSSNHLYNSLEGFCTCLISHKSGRLVSWNRFRRIFGDCGVEFEGKPRPLPNSRNTVVPNICTFINNFINFQRK
jgi:hypothetical protein